MIPSFKVTRTEKEFTIFVHDDPCAEIVQNFTAKLVMEAVKNNLYFCTSTDSNNMRFIRVVGPVKKLDSFEEFVEEIDWKLNIGI